MAIFGKPVTSSRPRPNPLRAARAARARAAAVRPGAPPTAAHDRA